MRTLWLAAYTPRLANGRGVRTYGVVAALARSGEVDLAYRQFDGTTPAPEFAALEQTRLRRVPDDGMAQRRLSYAALRLRGVPDGIARGAMPAFARAALGAPSDVRVVADGMTVAAALLDVAKRRPIVYCAHNLESSFRHTLVSEDSSPGALMRFERKLLERSAETWMVSEADIEGGRRLCPSARMRFVPNVVDARSLSRAPREPGSRRVLFVADLTYEPNRLALQFLRNEVRPLLQAQVPGAEIVVVGRGGLADDEAPGMRMLGRVDDLSAEYAAAAAVAVPLFHGGGSPLKFVEALAYGLPVVATPKAAAGLAVHADEHYLEAGDAQAFADQLVYALTSPAAEALGSRGRALALERYSIEALADSLRS